MITESGMRLAIGVTWVLVAVFVFLIARKCKSRKKISSIAYGASLAGLLMGASYIFSFHSLSVAYLGTLLALCCAILFLIEITREGA